MDKHLLWDDDGWTVCGLSVEHYLVVAPDAVALLHYLITLSQVMQASLSQRPLRTRYCHLRSSASCDLQRLALCWFHAPGLQLDNEVSQSTDQPHETSYVQSPEIGRFAAGRAFVVKIPWGAWLG